MEQAFRFSIFESLELLEKSNTPLTPTQIITLNAHITAHIDQAKSVFKKMWLADIHGLPLNKYEGWLSYVIFVTKHVVDPDEKSNKAKIYRKLIARRDLFSNSK
tara:strand:- start:149 stop:460 length:312 start_codon:yes stop_codon:yes gene_type:complete